MWTAEMKTTGRTYIKASISTGSIDSFTTRQSPPDDAALSISAPLYAIAIIAAMLGVVAGAFATWLSQGRHRRASRQSRVEADKWRAQAEALKAAQAQTTAPPALPRNR